MVFERLLLVYSYIYLYYIFWEELKVVFRKKSQIIIYKNEKRILEKNCQQ